MNTARHLLLLIFILISSVTGQQDIPEKPASWVNDYADVLSAGEEDILNKMLSALESRSSNQIFIAIFDKLPANYYLEDFTVKLYEKWRPGLEKQDNGILITVFIQDRKMRIEVGYGLEDAVTDAQSGVIIRDYMAPEFRNGNFFQGLKSALEILIPASEGKYKIAVERPSDNSISFNTIVLIVVILILIARYWGGNRPTGFGSKRRGRYTTGPFFLGGLGSFGSGSSGGGSSGGGGFSGGFGGLSGGGGASGGW